MKWYTCAFITIIFIIIAILLTILVFYLIVKRDLTERVYFECTGNVDAWPVFVPFTSPPSVYSKSNALATLRTCEAITYTNGCGHPMLVPAPDFQVVGYYDGYDPKGGVMTPFAGLFYSPSLKIMLLVFSATITVSEWYDNLMVAQTPPSALRNYLPGMLVHDGFYQIYSGTTSSNTVMPLYKSIQKSLTDNLHPGDILLIGGHSLGASLATLSFFDLTGLFPSNSTVLYTTGCPRVGNDSFAQFLSSRSLNFRLFNTEDIIPDVPFPFMGQWLYEHSSSQYEFTMSLGDYSQNHTDAYIRWLSI